MNEKLKETEDRVSLWLNGGECKKTQHPESTVLDDAVMWKALRLKHPYWGSSLHDLDALINLELRRVAK